jgi:CelD/BcsL family acetyltransferase involved in cellulose biosynthesis
MLIGWLDQGTLPFNVGPLALFRPEARIFHFAYGGFLGNQSRANSQFLVREIVRLLHEREAQAAVFSQLRVDSPLCEFAKRTPNIFCRDHFTPAQTHWYLNLPASFDEFFRGRSTKTRQNVERNARMLEKDFPGGVRFQSVRSERDVEDFARKADEVSQKTYQRALGVGFVNDLETREMLRAAAQKAALRACLLYVDNRPVAFACGIVCNKTLYADFTGYDPRFKNYSPGLQTQMRLIEESFNPRGSILRVDAGHGDSLYKHSQFDSSWEEHPVWIFAPTAKGLSLNAFKLVSTFFHTFVMRLFAKSEYLRRGKKIWHELALQGFQRRNFAQRSR